MFCRPHLGIQTRYVLCQIISKSPAAGQVWAVVPTQAQRGCELHTHLRIASRYSTRVSNVDTDVYRSPVQSHRVYNNINIKFHKPYKDPHHKQMDRIILYIYI